MTQPKGSPATHSSIEATERAHEVAPATTESAEKTAAAAKSQRLAAREASDGMSKITRVASDTAATTTEIVDASRALSDLSGELANGVAFFVWTGSQDAEPSATATGTDS